MIKRFFAILFLLLTVGSGVFSQNYSTLDSLIAMQENVHDSVLPRLYHDIARNAWSINPALGMQYAMLSQDAARTQDNKEYVARSLYMLAINERELGRYDEACRHFIEAFDEAKSLGVGNLELELYSSVGNAYMRMDSLDLAGYYVKTALHKSDSVHNSLLKGRACLNMGLISIKRGNLRNAIAHLERSHSIMCDSVPSVSERLMVVKELSNAYVLAGDFVKAKHVLMDYLEADSNMPELQRGQIYQMLANIYYRMDMLDSAAEANKVSIQCAMYIGKISMIGSNYMLMDSIYLAKKDYHAAAAYCRQFIDISDTVFNTALDEQLNKVRYSLDYLENKRALELSQRDRTIRYFFIAFGILAVVFMTFGIRHIVLTNRKIVNINKALDEKKSAITERVKFAYSIQKSFLPKVDDFGTSFADRFVYFAPRDIVSGDFYWRYSDSRYEILAVADCTGHGIPGAILTMLGSSILQDIAQHGIREACKILEILRERVVFMMSQNDREHMRDGMDISLVVVDRENNSLDFAGAYNSLYYVRDGKMNVLKASRAPIGKYPKMKPFSSMSLDMEPGDIYYFFSDGFVSQFGGREKRKYSMQRFLNLLLSIHARPMTQQKEILDSEIKSWKGHEEQVDDVTVVGLRF
ncbi:MAG: SpoIIE family protein phosphatase [Bacteroidales bacterium]|nr:SpoIIE family protein phosphatase [Bacteroidales bacterium]